jgi:hypothetical protein
VLALFTLHMGQKEAELAVTLATLLVQWFSHGTVRLKS